MKAFVVGTETGGMVALTRENTKAMATKGNSFNKAQKNLQGLATILKSAACEWFLIFLLLIDALLSYTLTKFAYICNLQTPCILCSRLEHFLGREKPNYNYKNLLCTNHKLEISSLISCSKHNKLVDGYDMCDACLCSFATNNEPNSNSKIQRLLVEKLRSGIDENGARGQLLSGNRDSVPHCIVVTKSCSCCGKPWTSRPISQLKYPVNVAVTKPNIPLPLRLNSRDSLKKKRDKVSSSVGMQLPRNRTGFDLLSHVEYSQLKITSDTESEVLGSEDDDDDSKSSLICEKSELKEDFVLRSITQIPLKTHFNNCDQVKPSINFFDSRPSPLESYVQVDVQKPHSVKSLSSDATILHGLSELNWLPTNQTADPSALPKLCSLDDAPTASDFLGLLCGKSMEKSKPTDSLGQDSALPELITLDCDPQFVGISTTSEETGTCNTGFASLNQLEHCLTLISPTDGWFPESHEFANEPAGNSNNIDHSDICESFAIDEEQGVTGESSEKKPDTVIRDLKQFQIHDTHVEQIIVSSNDEGQNHGISCNDFPDAITSQFDMIPVLDKSVAVESDVESLDGSNISEVEGENIVDRLKRQVEYDRKCISSLYQELDEERNASEVAANQAMAMITRLQEEKAAVHMEALQYLRMMEEQAEYDIEALEKANDLLNEKEKEIQDLEDELEFYKANYVDTSIVEIDHETSNFVTVNGNQDTTENHSVRSCEYNTTSSFKSTFVELSKKGSNRSLSHGASSPLGFEDEKIYIQLRLKSLEDKMNSMFTNGPLARVPNTNARDIEKLVHAEEKEEENSTSEGKKKQNDQLVCIDKQACNGSDTAEEELVDSDDTIHIEHEEHFSKLKNQISRVKERDVDLFTLEHKISDLTDRLETLQADYDFLQRSLNSLHYGKEGLQFIQDIASRLQELYKLGIKLDRQSGS